MVAFRHFRAKGLGLDLLTPLMMTLFIAACSGGGGADPDPDAGNEQDAGQVDASDDDSTGPDQDVSPDEDGPAVTQWTVLVYMVGDNNLEKSAIEDIQEMMALSQADHLRVLVQLDRAEDFYELGLAELDSWTAAKRLKVRPSEVEELADLGEINMAEPTALQDFITWGVNAYPADRTILILWNHGMSWRGFASDLASHDATLSIEDIQQAIEHSLTETGLPKFDLLGFDACLMADLSVVHAMRGFADYLVASEDLEPSHGWDYRSLEEVITNPDLSVRALGEQILDDYKAQAKEKRKNHSITLGLFELKSVDNLMQAVDGLASYLAGQLPANLTPVGRTRDDVQRFGRSSVPKQDFQMVDVGHFAQMVAKVDPSAQSLVDVVNNTLDQVVLKRVKGPMTRRSTGLSIYFPQFQDQYLLGFDKVAGMEAWRAMLAAYYTSAAAQDEPSTSQSPPINRQTKSPNVQLRSSCNQGGVIEQQIQIDQQAIQDTAIVYANIGYKTPAGRKAIIRRSQAQLDPDTGAVVTDWDQRVLAIYQGENAALLFSETTLDEAYAYHEVPLVYARQGECPCVRPGDPGYADTDGDGVANCLDPDQDGDGVGESESGDNCPFSPNSDQLDSDGDGVGDACQDESNAPSLNCTVTVQENVFSEQYPALLQVATHRISHEVVSCSLYVTSSGGVGEWIAKPGALFLPMVLAENEEGQWIWTTGDPLPMAPNKPLLFTYAPLDELLLTDENGIPLETEHGQGISLQDELHVANFFFEVVVSNAAGRGQVTNQDITQEELSSCPVEEPDWCQGEQIPDCQGTCSSPGLLGNGICDDGSQGADFNCQVFAYDQNDCTPPACPGQAGYLVDCNGNCLATAQDLGDGKCHTGQTPSQPDLACALFDFDQGDCPCGDNCSDHGNCANGACECTGGWTGNYCQIPPLCPNASCDPEENCKNCEADCGACPDPCGNGSCQAALGEDCTSCPTDCGACSCPDGACHLETESCSTCPQDCGACPQCGDEVCSVWQVDLPFSQQQAENCILCPEDCGECEGDCCQASDEPGGIWHPGGGCGDQEIARCVCELDPSCCELGWPNRCRDLAVNQCGLQCCVPQCADDPCQPDGCGELCGDCILCASGDEKCVANQAYRCDEQGLWQPKLACDESIYECVMQAGQATCRCVEGAEKCIDGDVYDSCDAQGNWRLKTDCDDLVETCVIDDNQGVCQCLPGRAKCLDNTVYRCSEQSVWEPEPACQESLEQCETNGFDAICHCGPEGTQTCRDGDVVVCDGQGLWQIKTDCHDTLEVCITGDDGANCQCIPGSQQCQDGNAFVCDDQGTWQLNQECVENLETCVLDGSAAFCQCIEGVHLCQNDDVTVCDQDGMWQTVVDCDDNLEHCAMEADMALCLCNQGAQVCQANDAYTCDLDSHWVLLQDCHDALEYCSLDGSQAVCHCSDGAETCIGDDSHFCGAANTWELKQDCDDSLEHCGMDGSSSVCQCNNGAQKCHNQDAYTCGAGQAWQLAQDCDDATESCAMEADTAVCQCLPSKERCEAGDAFQCGIDLHWEPKQDCDDTLEHCAMYLDQALCNCNSGAEKCLNDDAYGCDGLGAWFIQHDCLDSLEYCAMQGESAVCLCTEADERCDGDYGYVCDAEGLWQISVMCSDPLDSCEMEGNSAVCRCNPADEKCDLGDAYQCDGAGLWQLKEDCTAEQHCVAESLVANCVDNCVDLDSDGYFAYEVGYCPLGEDYCDDDANNHTTNGCTLCVDSDLDGYGDSCDLGTDCDDTDANAHSGNDEGPYGHPSCSDGIDNDCDLDVDIAEPTCTPGPGLNLLMNPGGEHGNMTGWTVTANGGDGWLIYGDGGDHSGENYFGTSHSTCSREQVLDLVALGFSEGILDTAPDIDVGEWFRERCKRDWYAITVTLLDASLSSIDSWSVSGYTSASTACSYGDDIWFEETHRFSGYGPGLRFIKFADEGRDTEGWGGWYGSRMDDAYVIVSP